MALHTVEIWLSLTALALNGLLAVVINERWLRERIVRVRPMNWRAATNSPVPLADQSPQAGARLDVVMNDSRFAERRIVLAESPHGQRRTVTIYLQ